MFNRASKRWFPDKHIGYIILNFEHPWIARYVEANEAMLRAFPNFDHFMDHLRDIFLPKYWEREFVKKIREHQEDQDFDT
jgi:hypothetical protein